MNISLQSMYEYVSFAQTASLFLFLVHFYVFKRKFGKYEKLLFLNSLVLLFLDLLSWYQYLIANDFPFIFTAFYAYKTFIFLGLFFLLPLKLNKYYLYGIIIILIIIVSFIYYFPKKNEFSIYGNFFHMATSCIIILTTLLSNLNKNQNFFSPHFKISLAYLFVFSLSLILEISYNQISKLSDNIFYSVHLFRNFIAWFLILYVWFICYKNRFGHLI